MSVTVRLYAGLRERADATEVEVSGATVAAVKEALGRAVPAIAGHLGSCRFAVDDEFVDESAPVRPGDVVHVVPPVSGG